MTIIFNVVLALAKRVPELDTLVARAGDDLSVVRAETDRENVRSVANKSAGGQTSVKVPQAQGMVPR